MVQAQAKSSTLPGRLSFADAIFVLESSRAFRLIRLAMKLTRSTFLQSSLALAAVFSVSIHPSPKRNPKPHSRRWGGRLDLSLQRQGSDRLGRPARLLDRHDGAIQCSETKETSKQTDLILLASEDSPEKFANFEIHYSFKWLTPGGNSGLQIRGKIDKPENLHVGGYQADIDAGNGYTGIIYDEGGVAGGRGIMSKRGEKTVWDAENKRTSTPLDKTDAEIKAMIKPVGEWNDVVVVADGNRITYSINGQVTTEQIDNSPKACKRRRHRPPDARWPHHDSAVQGREDQNAGQEITNSFSGFRLSPTSPDARERRLFRAVGLREGQAMKTLFDRQTVQLLQASVKRHSPDDWQASRRLGRARARQGNPWIRFGMLLGGIALLIDVICFPFLITPRLEAVVATGFLGMHLALLGLVCGQILLSQSGVEIAPLLNTPLRTSEVYRYALHQIRRGCRLRLAGGIALFVAIALAALKWAGDLEEPEAWGRAVLGALCSLWFIGRPPGHPGVVALERLGADRPSIGGLGRNPGAVGSVWLGQKMAGAFAGGPGTSIELSSPQCALPMDCGR